jgi:uncharacterized membrane protein YoaT (DUF817 family)
MIPTILCIIIFLCFQTESYVGPGNLGVFIVLLVLYGYVSFIYDIQMAKTNCVLHLHFVYLFSSNVY